MNGQTLSWSDADQQGQQPVATPPPSAVPPARRRAPGAQAAPPQVELDWSTAQPATPAAAAAPPAQAAPRAAPAAAAPPAQTAPPQVDLDWSTAQDMPVQSRFEHLVRSVNLAASGAEDPGQAWNQVKAIMNDPYYFDDPAKAYGQIIKAMHEGMKQTWEKADKEWDAGNFTTAHGLLNRADAVFDYVMSGVPGLGPALSQAGGQISAGDYAGGAGTAIGTLAPVVMGDYGTGAYTGPRSFKAPPMVPAVRDLVASQGENIGQVLGGAGGFIKSGGDILHAYAGWKFGGKVGRILQDRAARVPDAPTVSDLASAIKEEYGNNIPVSGNAVPASLYMEIKAANMDLSDTQIRGIAEDVMGRRPAAQPARPARPAPAPAPAPEAAPAPPAAAPAPTPAAASAVPPEAAAPAEEPPSAMRQQVEQANAAAAADVEARRQAYESMRRPAPTAPAAAAPTPEAPPAQPTAAPVETAAPAAAPTTPAAPPTPAPEAAPGAPAEAPATTPTPKAAPTTLPTRPEVAKILGWDDIDHMERVLGPDETNTRLENYFKDHFRKDAEARGVPTESDIKALKKQGLYREGMTYDEAQVALGRRPAPEAAPTEEAPAEAAPAAAPTALDNMRAQIQQADIAPDVKAKVQAGVESAMEEGDARTAQQLIDEAMPEEGKPTWREEWQQRWQEKLDAYDAKLAEMGTKRYAGFSTEAMPELRDLGRLLLERGLGEFDEWSRAMLDQLGNHVRPYLNDVWQTVKAGAPETLDYGDNISTRMPKSEGKFRGVQLISSEDPYTNQLHVSGDAILRRDPEQAAKVSDAVQGNTELKEPLENDRKQDGTRKYATPEDFQQAHDQWANDMKNQYVGTKIDPAIADNPRAVFQSFSDQIKRNLIKLYNFVPENIRQITSQWYDTARTEIAEQAARRGLENRQVAAVYASLSPQKDWFMNRSLANRLLDIWDNQQNATLDDAMRGKLKELTQGDKNADLKAIVDTGDLDGKTFSRMNTSEKAAFARIYDETYNDRSYNAQSPDGQDLGPVQKKGKVKGTTENADVAWGSLSEMSKAISALEDGSLENIQNQLLGSHKVPNFYNNMLTPNHPAGYVTIDTHAVAAGLLRALSQKALEVKQNFGGFGSVRSGTSGTYALYADAYRDAANELGIQPRQLQSITWEAIRDIFPKEWKANPANVAKINDIWRDFENGDATFDETFDKILDARGGKNIDWSAGRRNPVLAEEDEAAGDAGELRSHGVSGSQETGRPNAGRELNAPTGTAGEVGQTVPLKQARRARALVTQ